MRFLISTHAGLFVLEGSLTGGQWTAAILGKGYYYGAILEGDTFLVARRATLYGKESPTVFERYSIGGEFVELPYQPEGRQILDVHEMASGEEYNYICHGSIGGMSITDKEYNTIAALSFKASGFGDGLDDYSLINSVFVRGDAVWVTKHNRSVKNAELIKVKHHGNDLVLDTVYPMPDKGTHNVYIEGDTMYYNDSTGGAVAMLDLNDYVTEDFEKKGQVKVHKIAAGEHYHTKGMAAVEDMLVVGLSQEGDLRTRMTSVSSLLFLSKENLERRFILTPELDTGERLGNINNIMVLEP